MTRVFAAALVLAAVATGGAEQADQSPVFRGVGESVPVFVTVTDRSDRLVTSLTREQFIVRDNGRVQPLTVFDNSPQPIRLIVLIDLSGSMYGNLPVVREAGMELFKRLAPGDLAAVGTFGKSIEIASGFTRDERALMAALPGSIQPDAPTPLWRAILEAMDAFGDGGGRRVVLVISDGHDSRQGGFGQKYVGSFEVLDRAHRDNVMVYAVAMRSRGRAPGLLPPGNLQQRLTEGLPSPEFGRTAVETGGGYAEIAPRDDLGATFARIADELHSQYLLGFAPAGDGKRHEIDVRVSEGGMKVRFRKNYVAPRAASR
jgi:VWFA-related protein